MALTKVQNTGIADDAVTTDKIENSTVLAADLAASSVTNAKIATGTIGNDKLTNSSVTINGSSLSLGGSTTLKHIDWQAVTVADGSTQLTAEAGKGYFLDTNAGVIEVFFPSSPSRGDTIVLADYGGNFATNKAIINTGGRLIDSTTGSDFKLETNETIAEFVYVDANKGWLVKLNQAQGTAEIETYASFIEATGGTITTSGDFKIHSFTGDGCFVVSKVGNAAGSENVSYLVVAGGGGTTGDRGGAGGAGGYREGKCTSDPYTASPLNAPAGLPVSVQTYPITVGGGGTASGAPTANAPSGSNSVFSTITSAGGGGGARTASPAIAGGSGGGGNISAGPGGAGNTPPVSPPQGNNGGVGSPNTPPVGGGGGGGATQVGQNGTGSAGGDGGAGATTNITGSPVAYAGGGGGGHDGGSRGDGGTGGGGNGASGPYPGSSVAATAGSANTGGGGGGSNGGGTSQPGTAGGKGIVIIRYKFQ